MTDHIGWTDERVELLKKLWAEGFSASKISRILNGGFSRSAIIGKAYRLGLAGRSHASTTRASFKQRKAKASKVGKRPGEFTFSSKASAKNSGPEFTPEPVVFVPEVLPDKLFMLADWDEAGCKWPYSIDPKSTARFGCTHAKELGMPYCANHVRRATSQASVSARRSNLVTGRGIEGSGGDSGSKSESPPVSKFEAVD